MPTPISIAAWPGICQKDHAGAIRDYTQRHWIERQNPRTYENRGLCRHETEDYHRRDRRLQPGIGLDSKYAKAYSSRGSSKYEQKNYVGAAADFRKALELDHGRHRGQR